MFGALSCAGATVETTKHPVDGGVACGWWVVGGCYESRFPIVNQLHEQFSSNLGDVDVMIQVFEESTNASLLFTMGFTWH